MPIAPDAICNVCGHPQAEHHPTPSLYYDEPCWHGITWPVDSAYDGVPPDARSAFPRKHRPCPCDAFELIPRPIEARVAHALNEVERLHGVQLLGHAFGAWALAGAELAVAQGDARHYRVVSRTEAGWAPRDEPS